MKKTESNKHFWNLKKKRPHLCQKALGEMLNFSSARLEVHFEYLFLHEF